MKNVLNMLGKLLKIFLIVINSLFYENLYSYNCRMLTIFDHLFELCLGRENILNIFLKMLNMVIKYIYGNLP